MIMNLFQRNAVEISCMQIQIKMVHNSNKNLKSLQRHLKSLVHVSSITRKYSLFVLLLDVMPELHPVFEDKFTANSIKSLQVSWCCVRWYLLHPLYSHPEVLQVYVFPLWSNACFVRLDLVEKVFRQMSQVRVFKICTSPNTFSTWSTCPSPSGGGGVPQHERCCCQWCFMVQFHQGGGVFRNMSIVVVLRGFSRWGRVGLMSLILFLLNLRQCFVLGVGAWRLASTRDCGVHPSCQFLFFCSWHCT